MSPFVKFRIDTSKLEEGDHFHCRNEIPGEDGQSMAIRIGVSSFGNHDAMAVKVNGVWYIAEAVTPVSKLTTIEEFEARMSRGYYVQVYRLRYESQNDRRKMAEYFVNNLLGLRYPKKYRMILLASRIWNAIDWLPSWHSENWCSQLLARADTAIRPACLDGRGGKRKKYFTPKTFENRILQALYDRIDDVIIPDQNKH